MGLKVWGTTLLIIHARPLTLPRIAGESGVDALDLRLDERRFLDGELLSGCRQGRAESWDALVRRYEGLVYSVAMRTGLNAADAADVTQSTFVALLESLDSLREEEKLSSWLATVARRQASKMRRKTAHEFLQGEAFEPDPVEEAAWADILDLQRALTALDAPCRDLLTALYFDPAQPSYVEIAERFNRTVGGIGPMRGRCLKRMRTMLEQTP